MAAAPNHSFGFFSVVCSRLRAASSAWRRKPADNEATIRSRLARRAGAKRRLGRILAFVSFNLELLLFVYAFWRARRRSFNWTWRQPPQALPILVIPALAALIYAASVRFIRALDLKDKITLGRLQQQNDSHHNELNSAKKCAPVDEATSFASQSDPTLISKLEKHDLPSTNLRDDGGGDRSWGCTKDFHPNYMQSTVEHYSNSGPDVVENDMAYSTEASPCLPGCIIPLLVSNATGHADFCSQMSCPKSNGGLSEEDDAQKSDGLPVIAELHHEGVENKSSKFHGLEDNRMPFVLEEEILMGPYAVQNTESQLGTSGYTLCSQETEKENVAGGACFVEVVPESSFLSSQELVVDSGNNNSKKESCTPNIDEESDIVVNSEDEALLIMPAVNTAEQCSGTSGFSLRAQDSNMMEIPAITNIFPFIPESNCPTYVELVAEDNETSDVNLPEQKHWEAFVDPLVDAFEDSLATSEFLSCSAVAKITEVPVVVKEAFSEGPSIHQNVSVASSADGGNTEYVMSDSVPVVVIPETNITGALQDGHETLSDPLYRSSFHSAGIFLSPSEVSNGEAYSRNSNPYSLYDNLVENDEPLGCQGGGTEPKDEMNFACVDTPIFLNEVTCVESCTDTAGCSHCIPERYRTQSLHSGKRSLPEISQRSNFSLEESSISPDQKINLQIFSLYSRSSSCVSEVNMLETLRDGTFSAPETENDFNFDEKVSMKHENIATSAEFIPEINMTDTLDVVFDASEGLQAGQGQGFSKVSEDNFSSANTNITTKEISDDGVYLTNVTRNLQNSKKTSNDASESAQPRLPMPQDIHPFTLHRTCISPDRISNAKNLLTADHASDMHSTVGSRFFRPNASPEAQPADPLMFKETSIYPDSVSVSENNSDNTKLLLCSSEVNLIESLGVDQTGTDQQQDETSLVFEDIYMARQGATSEIRLNNLGYQHVSDASMTETLHGAERISSEIFHDDMFCVDGSSISLDGGNDPDNSSTNSGSVMHAVQKNTVVLLGLQGCEKAMVSISQYEVDIAEINGSNCIYDEGTMTGIIQGINKSPAQSHDEHPRAYVPAYKANHPEYLRSSSSMADNNLIVLLAAGQEGSFDIKGEDLSSFEETSLCENLPHNLMSVSHTSKKESVTSSGKGLPDPTPEGIDSFDKIPGDEQANKSLEENVLSCEHIARTRAEVNCAEIQDFTEATKPNCSEAFRSFNGGFFEPEHQEGPELVLSQVGMPFLIDEGEETEKDLGSSSIACASSHHETSILEPLQVLPVSAGSEKGFVEGSKVCEQSSAYKEPKDLKVKDMKEDIEDLDEDHEDFLAAAENASVLAQNPLSKFCAKDLSWRIISVGTNNDFQSEEIGSFYSQSAVALGGRSNTV